MPQPIQFHHIDQHKWTIAAILILTIVLFFGGSARDDVPALLLLRPFSVLVCVFYAAVLDREDWRRLRVPLGFLGLSCIVMLLQLVPLPPAIWHALPGRDIVVSADAAAGIEGHWRPLAMIPDRTINALWSLLVPTAIMLSLAKVRSHAFRSLAMAALAMAILSILLGVLQVTLGELNDLSLYPSRSGGSAAGFFANRNHNAVFVACTIPILFALANTGTPHPRLKLVRRWLFGTAIVICLGIVLAIGSRAGLLAAVIAVAGLPLIAPDGMKTARHVARAGHSPRNLALAALGIALFFPIVFASLRTQSAERLLMTDASDTRLLYWGPVVEMIWKYFPVGSGFGSFVQIYKIDEPFSTLDSTYVNHAHNDILETLLNGGVPGALLMGLATFIWVIAILRLLRRKASSELVIFHRTGALLLFILALASIVDYPLRTPFLMGFAALCATWMCRPFYASTRCPKQMTRDSSTRPARKTP